ncbi:hypothetical protein [Parasitella parasitica]|uniref:C2H2-type domain-containing protein n=1 Tax=Parasitella parasitica TaxID=35722 RepID=A0A0B7NDR9_9FUNG|nr:hypothetical protein [Parasitella parasitica]
MNAFENHVIRLSCPSCVVLFEQKQQLRAHADQHACFLEVSRDCNDNHWDRSVTEGFPFENPQTLVMMCLFNGYANPLFRSQLKTLLYGIGKIVDLALAAASDGKPFKLPTANKIMKMDEGKKYAGPTMKTTTIELNVIIKQQEEKRQCSANLPSEHLILSKANPREAPYLSALPKLPSYRRKQMMKNEYCLHDLFIAFTNMHVDQHELEVVAFVQTILRNWDTIVG